MGVDAGRRLRPASRPIDANGQRRDETIFIADAEPVPLNE
jgi:hypothetical protein